MGRAARWLRRIFGGRRADPEAKANKEEEERRRWGGLGKSFRESDVEVRRPRWGPPPRRGWPHRDAVRGRAERGAAAAAAVEGGGYGGGGGDDGDDGDDEVEEEDEEEDEEEESKRAIAVAAATAAVAEAAVAAAQAAAAVVKLTSGGNKCVSGELRRGGGGGRRRESAAVKIQAVFRGYLARKALRALRGLVKLQALVRGNIVRKQAAETLRCMHALVRVQARARACRSLRAQSGGGRPCPHPGPPTEHNIRTNTPKSDRFGSLEKSLSTEVIDRNTSSHSSAWNWLDRWMEDRYWDNHKPATKSGRSTTTDDEKNAKILEVDPGKPQFNNNSKKSRGFTTAAADSDSTTAQLSIPSPSTADVVQPLSSLQFPAAGFEEFGERPQFYSATSQQGRGGLFALSKGYFGSYLDYPNYMANTESSKAKARSQSAPKQRPEYYEKSGLIKRGQVSGSSSGSGFGYGYGSGSGSGQQHNSAASVPQKSSASLQTKFANKAYPGSGRLDRLGMPIRY